MRFSGWIVAMLLFISLGAYGQSERKFIRRGNQSYQQKDYTQSEVKYRKALEKDGNSFKAAFNVGDALYQQGKYKEAARQFNSLTSRDVSDQKLARAYHNLGNSLLKSKQLRKSISAYKNALRHDPGDKQTKHNLTYALRQLKKQQKKKQQQEKQQNQQSNQNQKQKQQNQQKQKQQHDKNDPNRRQQQNKQQEKKQQKKQSANPSKKGISKEDARRLLQALANDEEQLQKQLKKKKAKNVQVKTTKNW